jgi:hypothetical protein
MAYKPGTRVGTRLPRSRLVRDGYIAIQMRAQRKTWAEVSAALDLGWRNCMRHAEWLRDADPFLAFEAEDGIPFSESRFNYRKIPFLPVQHSPKWRKMQEVIAAAEASKGCCTQDGPLARSIEARSVDNDVNAPFPGDLALRALDECVSQAEIERDILAKIARLDELRAQLKAKHLKEAREGTEGTKA